MIPKEHRVSVEVWRLGEPRGPEKAPAALTSLRTKRGRHWAAWSADSRRLAVGRAGRSVRILQADSGKELVRLADPAAKSVALAFSPQGDRLAALGATGQMDCWQCDSGQMWPADLPCLSIPGTTGSIGRMLSATPVLAGKRPPSAERVTLKAGMSKPPRSCLAGNPGSQSMRWPFRRRLAVATVEEREDQGETQVLPTAAPPVAGRDPLGSVPGADQQDGLCGLLGGWPAAGREPLAERKGRTRPETATGQEVWVCHPGGVHVCLAFAPDSRHLVVSAGKEVWVHDLVCRRPVGLLRGHEEWITSMSFSPDGRTLATTAWGPHGLAVGHDLAQVLPETTH